MYIHSLKFSCSKSYEDFPCSHRQWRHEGHCRFVHGYSRSFTFWFTAKKLDLNGFVVDFSSLKPLEKRLNKKNLKFKITDEAINQLVKNSFDYIYGARPLKRIIQKQIETKISNNILNNYYLNKDEINIYLVNGEIIVD